jgi:hypothetical protein
VTMQKICSACNEIIEGGKNFCPKCGKNLNQIENKTGKTIAGGILLIIAAAFCLIATLYTMFFVNEHQDIIFLIAQLIFGLWGTGVGLVGGIDSLRRSHFVSTVIGSSFVVVAACINFTGVFYNIVFLIFGIIILILGLLSTVLIAISINEFQ